MTELVVSLYDKDYELISYDDSSYYLSDDITFPPRTEADYDGLVEGYIYDYMLTLSPDDADKVHFAELSTTDDFCDMIAELENGTVVQWYDTADDDDLDALRALGIIS